MRIKFGIFCRLRKSSANIDLKGSGTKEDPYILIPFFEKLRFGLSFYSFNISHSNSYIQLTNNKKDKAAPFFLKDNPFYTPYEQDYLPKRVVISNCTNVTIVNSFFSKINIIESSDITIQNVTIMRKLEIKASSNIELVDSNINMFNCQNSKDIFISLCSINEITKKTDINSLKYLN